MPDFGSGLPPDHAEVIARVQERNRRNDEALQVSRRNAEQEIEERAQRVRDREEARQDRELALQDRRAAAADRRTTARRFWATLLVSILSLIISAVVGTVTLLRSPAPVVVPAPTVQVAPPVTGVAPSTASPRPSR